jgi:hypothetical protein
MDCMPLEHGLRCNNTVTKIATFNIYLDFNPINARNKPILLVVRDIGR